MTEYEYRVTWTVLVTASTPEAAAAEALRLQRDPESEATVFDIDRVLSTAPADGRPLSFESCGQHDPEGVL